LSIRCFSKVCPAAVDRGAEGALPLWSVWFAGICRSRQKCHWKHCNCWWKLVCGLTPKLDNSHHIVKFLHQHDPRKCAKFDAR
jgi:hypothetical protein